MNACDMGTDQDLQYIYNVPIFDISVGLFYINVPAISEKKQQNIIGRAASP